MNALVVEYGNSGFANTPTDSGSAAKLEEVSPLPFLLSSTVPLPPTPEAQVLSFPADEGRTICARGCADWAVGRLSSRCPAEPGAASLEEASNPNVSSCLGGRASAASTTFGSTNANCPSEDSRTCWLPAPPEGFFAGSLPNRVLACLASISAAAGSPTLPGT